MSRRPRCIHTCTLKQQAMIKISSETCIRHLYCHFLQAAAKVDTEVNTLDIVVDRLNQTACSIKIERRSVKGLIYTLLTIFCSMECLQLLFTRVEEAVFTSKTEALLRL